jgi:hypothetical protein
MPYIEPEKRREILEGRAPDTAGELNYSLTVEILDYAKAHNNYQGFNDIIGALEAAKAEFYRRWVAPYEDYKIAINGDVYPTGG